MEADVVMVPKPGKDVTLPDSFRPISLLSGVAKITEAVVLFRLRDELQTLEAIPNDQFGFRAGLSTDLQLYRLTEEIRGGIQERMSTVAVFLDISNAFDTVWHGGLIYKMSVVGINPTLVRLIISYLSGRSFMVKFKYSFQCPGTSGLGFPRTLSWGWSSSSYICTTCSFELARGTTYF